MKFILFIIFTIFSSLLVSSQTIDDILVLGDIGNEIALQSHLSVEKSRYTAVFHRKNFNVDSLGNSVVITAATDNGNPFDERTLSIIKYDSNDTYQMHISMMFYVNRNFNTSSYTVNQTPALLINSDNDGNVFFAITYNDADSTDIVDANHELFKRVYNNTLIDRTQLMFLKISGTGEIIWSQTLSNKTLHAPTDSISPFYNREIHSLTIGNNGITSDIDMYDTYKPFLDTLTLAHNNGSESIIPVNGGDIQLRFDTNGNLIKKSENYSLQTENGSEHITILNAVSNSFYRYVLIKVETSISDSIILNNSTLGVNKGETVILLKYDTNDSLLWSKVIGKQNLSIFYPPYLSAPISSNFTMALDQDQDKNNIILAFNYYHDNFNLNHNPSASAVNNYNYNIATLLISSLDGNINWYSINGGSYFDEIISVTPYQPTKGLLLIGKSNSTDLTFGSFSNLNPNGISNYFMFFLITDSIGNFIRIQLIQDAYHLEFYGPQNHQINQQGIGYSISHPDGTAYITGSFQYQLKTNCKNLLANNIDALIIKLSPYNKTLDTSVCKNLISPSGKYIWDSTGIYSDTIPNAKGCDSILWINLNVLQSKSSLDSAVCNQMVSYSGDFVWDSTGTYHDTIPNYKGCDSVITLHLSILQSKSNLDSAVCNNMVSYSGKYTWNISGTYNDTITNYKGCDSIITVNLKVLKTYKTIDTSNCKAILSPSGKYIWASSGIYLDTIANSKTCDSIITIKFTRWFDTTSIRLSACKQLTSPSGKYVYLMNGNYTDTLLSSKGCDSILFIAFTQTGSTSSVTRYFCDSLISPSGNYVYRSSGQYFDTIPNHLGCDSIIQLQLQHQPLVTSISSSNDISCDTPFSQLNATGGTVYQWWPPDQISNPTIANPIAQFLQTTSVYVQISDSLGCKTTDSLTINVNKTETIKDLANVFTPNNDGLNDCLKLSNVTQMQSVTWQIFNRWGALVFESSNPDDCWNGQTLTGSDAENGTYYFILKAVSNCETNIELHGSIMLIR